MRKTMQRLPARTYDVDTFIAFVRAAAYEEVFRFDVPVYKVL